MIWSRTSKNGTLVVGISGTIWDLGDKNVSSTTFHNSAEMAFLPFSFNIGLSQIHGLTVLMDVLNHMTIVLLRKLRDDKGTGDYDRL